MSWGGTVSNPTPLIPFRADEKATQRIAQWVGQVRRTGRAPALVLCHQDTRICREVAEGLTRLLGVPLSIPMQVARSPLALGPTIAAHLRHLPVSTLGTRREEFPLAVRIDPGLAPDLLAADAAPGWVFAKMVEYLDKGFREKLFKHIALVLDDLGDDLGPRRRQLQVLINHEAVLPVFCAASAHEVLGAGHYGLERGTIYANLRGAAGGGGFVAAVVQECVELRQAAQQQGREMEQLRARLALHETRGVVG